MPKKDFELDNGLAVSVYKHKASRHLRLTVSAAGKIRVSIPSWAPYKSGLDFARSRQGWIAQQAITTSLLKPGQPIGKAHHLEFITKDIARPGSRLQGSKIIISHPLRTSFQDPGVQMVAQKAGLRALRQQAEQLLPQRLASLAASNDFSYKSVSIKNLKSRWGSCDQDTNISLSLFLMQLPWHLIDYVLLHELTHTQILRHGPGFWQAMEAVLPNSKALRREIKAHHPVLT